MSAHEALGDVEAALADCTSMIILEPQDLSLRKSLKRLNELKSEIAKKKKSDKIEKKTVIEQQPIPGEINFINKPANQRSKKPLRRVPIIETSYSSPQPLNDPFHYQSNGLLDESSDKIPDEVIDELFNNSTGESTRKSTRHNMFYSSNLPSTSNKFQVFPVQSLPPLLSSDPVIVTNPIESVETKEENNNDDSEEILPSTDQLPQPPQSGPQFYTVWKELTTSKKYSYLKLISELPIKDINKILSSSLDTELISEFITILSVCFVKHNWSVVNIMKSISRHDEISILSMMLSANDKLGIEKIINFMMSQNVSNEDLTLIRNGLDL